MYSNVITTAHVWVGWFLRDLSIQTFIVIKNTPFGDSSWLSEAHPIMVRRDRTLSSLGITHSYCNEIPTFSLINISVMTSLQESMEDHQRPLDSSKVWNSLKGWRYI